MPESADGGGLVSLLHCMGALCMALRALSPFFVAVIARDLASPRTPAFSATACIVAAVALTLQCCSLAFALVRGGGKSSRRRALPDTASAWSCSRALLSLCSACFAPPFCHCSRSSCTCTFYSRCLRQCHKQWKRLRAPSSSGGKTRRRADSDAEPLLAPAANHHNNIIRLNNNKASLFANHSAGPKSDGAVVTLSKDVLLAHANRSLPHAHHPASPLLLTVSAQQPSIAQSGTAAVLILSEISQLAVRAAGTPILTQLAVPLVSVILCHVVTVKWHPTKATCVALAALFGGILLASMATTDDEMLRSRLGSPAVLVASSSWDALLADGWALARLLLIADFACAYARPSLPFLAFAMFSAFAIASVSGDTVHVFFNWPSLAGPTSSYANQTAIANAVFGAAPSKPLIAFLILPLLISLRYFLLCCNVQLSALLRLLPSPPSSTSHDKEEAQRRKKEASRRLYILAAVTALGMCCAAQDQHYFTDALSSAAATADARKTFSLWLLAVHALSRWSSKLPYLNLKN